MAYFMTRIELHSATPDDYNTLHAAMEAAGFSRIVPAADGKHYHLPSGMYFLDSYADTAATVRDRANAVAATTGKSREVLVTQGTSAWIGLTVVQATNASSTDYFR
ncbi:type V toxin-antitoxin system endoribonuclease antitoxin GhoS [Sorangium sp. So ce1153]|uniref:type V toxin-antitoxin system endoribonuclease antitoxin GhoS n=1 Tax=Sorangium sp. So ce1153 TaxID=3133333 RepID=UPI003F62D51F